ncbi:UDP-glucose/GDP-mannose dehydrogenase family protein [Alicyclobacillus fastidiosus]|uniref:UDP-glucose 6-dehydrogenase n=1 Tax=Alicyclobacillus fastidiosus TaxID=392011 RepID=A0ABY6ZCC1_9BACL|nr:UDP-glucose/GDP-mannose dehydrogenase family protein [Alicyclobacillus fastidiosus]WAH39906.1 UDP-glucose/GDP-mannose dehydrogenase family protein [Alicyclobacillus fastidiosus]GMA61179.1 UDP-glucose 6-dehydrogenase TuaD [Alicyclobacillus fastidiosus]
MKVLVVGTGYVGLVTGVCLASFGHDVVCVDQDQQKITMLNMGECPIYEDGLEPLLQEQLLEHRLWFDTKISDCADFDIALIAVGTPPRSDGSADLTSVFEVVTELGNKLKQGALIGTKSTVPVGTAHSIETYLETMGRRDIRVVSIPEFLREGSALSDTLQPSRLIFGVPDDESLRVLKQLHSPLDVPIVACNRSTAEMIKYASNAFLATKISFINEIANICERVGADVQLVSQGMGLDPRIGSSFLRAGLGYGGSCFPKDTRALVNIAGDVAYDFKLLKAVVEVNQRQRTEPIERLRQWFGDLNNLRVTLLGVAFKPGTNDIRESPALEIGERLRDHGAQVQFYDPVVTRFWLQKQESVRVMDDPYVALQNSDAAIVVTEWPEIVELDWIRVGTIMRGRFVFDGRNVLDPVALERAGFVLENFGFHPAPSLAATSR